MLKLRLRSVLTIVVVLALCTCVDPYVPNLKGYESLLVIDGLVTDANTSYTVKLSRTFQDQSSDHLLVADGAVFITDDKGNSSFLHNRGGGIYKTDSIEFRGVAGRTYVLHIQTGGDVYESAPCLLRPVPDIDSIYFAKDQHLVSNGTQSQEGVTIYLDSKEGDNNSYYRWDFDETWKYIIPIPKRYDYINANTFVPVTQIKRYCWKSRKSNEVLIRPVYPGQSVRIMKEPIFFIATGESDRLMLEYSILVRQYSISKNEYDFWDNLNKVNETGSDIFASQPYPVISNIHNINNQKEKVLGYFRVSAVKEKRIFITFNEIVKLHLPFYYNAQCKKIEAVPESKMTIDDLYGIYCITSDYEFIEPFYDQESGLLKGLVFARPECTGCELTGTMTKPDFWIDLY
jgi:hypothetical protein